MSICPVSGRLGVRNPPATSLNVGARFIKRRDITQEMKLVTNIRKQFPMLSLFARASDVLSNFHPCELKAFGVTHKLSEHAFQYVKAVLSGDIPRFNNIQSASTALDSIRINKTISASNIFLR